MFLNNLEQFARLYSISSSLFHFVSANSRNVSLYYLYRQYTNLLYILIYTINSSARDKDSCLAWCEAKNDLEFIRQHTFN